MAAKQLSQTDNGTTPGLPRPEDFSTADFEECLQKGKMQLENGDLCSAEKSFAGALRLVTVDSRDREAVCLLRLGEVYKKRGELSCPKDHSDLIKASALLNAALTRIDDTSNHHAPKHDAGISSQDNIIEHTSAGVPPGELNLELQQQDTSSSPDTLQADCSKDYIKSLLREIEIIFVNGVTGLQISKAFQSDNTEEHKKKLMEIRSECETELNNIAKKYSTSFDQSDEERKSQELAQGTEVRDLYCNIAEDMKTLVRDLLTECVSVIGGPPRDVKYAVVGLGSLARQEMTPYSDLEFAILVQEGNNTDDVRTYFKTLTRYLHLKILNLGETILPAVGVQSLNDFTSRNPLDDWYHDSLTPRGFAFDGAMPWASKTPLGREQGVSSDQLTSLILTPSEMAALQTDPRALDWSHLREVLTCVTLIHGDPSLMQDYETLLHNILFQQVDQFGTTLGMCRATKNLLASLQEFKTDLSGMLSAGKLFQVKKEIYRMPSILLSSIALFFGITEKSSWEIVQALQRKGVINVEAEHNLKVAVSIATQLRLRTYLSNMGQKDNLSILPTASLEMSEGQKGEEEQEVHPAPAIFGMESPAILFRFFETLLPLEESVGSLFSGKFTGKKSSEVTPSTLHPRLESSLRTEEFYDSSLKNRALVHMRLLQYQDAKACLEQYIAETDEGDALQSSILIGQVLYHLGDYKGAVTCFRNLTDRRLSSKKDKISVVTFLRQAHHQNGNLQEASRCFEEALNELRKKVKPESDLSETELLNNLACALRSSGKYTEAISCFEEALAMDGGGKKQRQGNPRVAVIFNNMGDAYQSEGQYAKAIQCYVEALTIEQKIYGDNRAHPFVAATLHNLGSAYRDIGDFSAAMSAFRSSLQIKEIVFCMDAMHPEIATTLDGLAALKRHQGDFAQAQQLNAQALFIRRTVFGENADNLEIAESLANMGVNCLERPKDFQEGLSFLEEAYKMRKRIFKNASHPCIAKSLHNVGVALYKLEQYELALTKHKEALEMFREIGQLGVKNLDIAAALGGIGSCLCHLGDTTEGRLRLEEALTMFKSISGFSNPDIIKLYSTLAKVMMEQGDIKEAIDLLTEALDAVKSSRVARSYHGGQNASNEENKETMSVQNKKGDDKEGVALPRSYTAEEATILGQLGVACTLSGDDRAMSFLQESLTAARQVHGQNHHSVATALGNLGAAKFQEGTVLKAIEHFTESLQILEGLYGKDGSHTSLEEVLTNLGYAFEEKGDLRTALAYFDRVLDIQRRKGVLDDPKNTTMHDVQND